MGEERIVTLTGWTHRLHTNTKRKCVSILCVAEHSITNFNGDGVNTHPLKTSCRRPQSSEGTKRVTPKELVSSNAWLTHAGHAKKTKEWDGRGAHSYTDGMDSQTAHKHKEKMC